MNALPLLRTGSVTQYPLQRTLLCSTTTLRFVDGSEQRVAMFRQPKRRWTIRLSDLDETETIAMVEFFRDQQGAFDRFSFTDPATGVTYPQCRFADDQLAVNAEKSGGGSLVFTVCQEE